MIFRIFLRPVLLLASGLFWLGFSPAHADTPPLPDPTTFSLAIETGQIDQIKIWLKAGLHPDFSDERIGSGLMIAAWHGHIPIMEAFLQQGAKIDLSNRYDEQALQLAVWRGHLEAVRWLLDHGAPPKREGARWSALHYAAFANRPDIGRLLVERGADVNARAPNGSTVLMMAAREGHTGLARQLLDAGADPHLHNETGDTALTWAMRHGHYTLAKAISSQGEFARAAQASPASFGPPVRSVAAPPEMEEILRQIRLAQSSGKPTAALRKQLMAAVEHFKQNSRRIVIGSPERKTGKFPSRGKPEALMITAKRTPTPGQGGERAELLYQTPSVSPTTPVTSATSPSATATPPSPAAGETSEISAILEQMQRARANGQAIEPLRQQLYQAVARAKSAS